MSRYIDKDKTLDSLPNRATTFVRTQKRQIKQNTLAVFYER